MSLKNDGTGNVVRGSWKVSTEATYEVPMGCTNCSAIGYLEIPFGVRKPSVAHTCPKCGCEDYWPR